MPDTCTQLQRLDRRECLQEGHPGLRVQLFGIERAPGHIRLQVRARDATGSQGIEPVVPCFAQVGSTGGPRDRLSPHGTPRAFGTQLERALRVFALIPQGNFEIGDLIRRYGTRAPEQIDRNTPRKDVGRRNQACAVRGSTHNVARGIRTRRTDPGDQPRGRDQAGLTRDSARSRVSRRDLPVPRAHCTLQPDKGTPHLDVFRVTPIVDLNEAPSDNPRQVHAKRVVVVVRRNARRAIGQLRRSIEIRAIETRRETL